MSGATMDNVRLYSFLFFIGRELFYAKIRIFGMRKINKLPIKI